MKKPLFVLSCLILASRAPAVELVLETDKITPTSTIEVRFENPMVDKSRVGTAAEKPPLVAQPPVTGEFKWTSSRSGQFRFTKAPPMGTGIVFSTVEGLKDAAGNPVEPEEFDALAAEDFKVEQAGRISRYIQGAERRRPVMALVFNDAVNPAVAGKRMFFVDRTGQNFVPAKVRTASAKDLQQFRETDSYRSLQPAPTWAEQFAGVTPQAGSDEKRANLIIVEAIDPLPIGDGWTLKVNGEITNSDGTAKLKEALSYDWGNIEPLVLKEARPVTHFDEQHEIVLEFNKSLAAEEKPEETAAKLAKFIKVEPQPANYSIEPSGSYVSLRGDYELGKPYTVTVAAGLPADDGLALGNAVTESRTFKPSEAFVSTPAFENSQLAAGNGIFDIYAANFQDLHIRVKQLADGELVKARALYQDNSKRRWDNNLHRYHAGDEIPFERFPGKIVYDKTISNKKPLEKATVINLKWRDVLGQTPAAPVVIEIEAPPQDGAPSGTVINRAVVEFTDIGLMAKEGGPDLMVYAFSLRTGQPLNGVDVTLMDDERGYLRTTKTDTTGTALTAGSDVHWILAKQGADSTALKFDQGRGEGSIRLWQHGINYAWNSPWKQHLQTFFFSDRPVYKPGETAHVKAIARYRMGDTLSLGNEPIRAKLVVTDPRGRAVVSKDVAFSVNGTWNDEVKFPEAPVGWYSLNLTFEKAKSAVADDDDNDRWSNGRQATLSLRVDEFKANTFEVAIEGDKYKIARDRIKVPLHANYYMGKALSSAKAAWNASIQQDYAPPAEYANFSFGDLASWWHYGEDRDEESGGHEKSTPDWGAHGELTLADDGTATIELPPPPMSKAALPQNITVTADVTDVNQQTISASTQFQLPGAEFLVGVRKMHWYGTAEKPMDFEFAAITPEGEAFGSAVPVDVKIERQEWNTVRVRSAGGIATTKNQATLIEESKSTVNIEAVKGAGKSVTAWNFTPKKSGTYFLTATAHDAKGTTVFTRMAFYVIGAGGYPWAWEDGDEMELQPEKTSVKPGETLNIVVKTPFSGNAIVTVERNRIHRRFMVPLSPGNPVVKVPITEEDAPNMFVSVMVIRGAADSPQKNPMPEYKVGYCEIQVESETRKLFVETKSELDPILPSADQMITATVKDAAGKPVAGSEVTLYAVDEGVLSLMSYETPKPYDVFHAPMPLAVKTSISLGRLLSEDVDNRYRGNKGIVVGGGGDDAELNMRKNFVATAIWIASVDTDAEGHAVAKFKAPDNLTRYRVMAVAVKDADRFGSGESSFTVNKPLMLDPVVPRFAHLGDEILVKAVLHNTTKFSGEVELELKLDDTATFISEQRSFALASFKNRSLTNDGKLDRRTVTLKAGESAAFAFPVKFVKTGTCTWEWRARTAKWSDATALGDGVESKFEVTHPAPALREVHYFELTHAKSGDDLLKKINPQLLESDGQLRLDFNRSRMGEARDALEHLLHYPYGCVEQTTSSTLPWLALSKYDALFPDLLEAGKVRSAVQKGADRLLTMQTDQGGLAYWPGGTEPLLWASAYGGFGLLKAREFGIAIPDDVIDSLMKWMSEDLRKLDLRDTKDSYHLYDAPFALYVLAKAHRAEIGYQNVLFERRDRMPEMARLFLALAMEETKAPQKQVAELLALPAKDSHWERYWLGDNTAAGLRMMVLSNLGRHDEANKVAGEAMDRRNYWGHWGTTFSNAWVLMGLSASEGTPSSAGTIAIKTDFGGKKESFTLKGPLDNATANFAFSHKTGATPLHVLLPDGKNVHGRIELKAWPDIKTFQPVQKGFGINRRYERLTPEGTLEAPKNLRVGDLIVVTLDINVIRGDRYLAIEDPLPSVFEPVNPEFGTQNQRNDAKAQDNAWYCDHRELRDDKALFFTNDWTKLGRFELKYLARVIAEGDVMAPPARIEAMYEPDHYGLSEAIHVETLPMVNGRNVAGK